MDFLCADWDEDDWATDCVNGGGGGSPGIPSGDETKRMGGEAAIRKPPRTR